MSPRTLWAPAALTVLAALLRFPTLDRQSFWLDEAATVVLLRMPFLDMVRAVPDSESTPPFYYVVAWGWASAFGSGEVGVRSLSALAGTLTVPALYAAGTALVSRRAGLVAAALGAVNPLLVWYSQEARAYALLVLLTAIGLWLFARARGEKGTRALWGWAAVSAAALATHYFAAFVVLPEALILLAGRRRRALGPVAALAAAGTLLLPLLLHQRANARAAFIEDSPLSARALQVPKQYLVGFDAPFEALMTIAAAVAVLLAALWLTARRPRGAGLAVALAGVSLLVPLVLAVGGADYLITRNVIASLVPGLVALGAGFAAGGRAGVTVAGALAVGSGLVALAVPLVPQFQRDPWRGAAAALGPLRGGRAIAFTPAAGRLPLEVYLSGARDLPARGAVVGEVAVVALAEEGRVELAYPTLPPGVRAASRVRTPGFTVVRYRAARPFAVSRAALAVSAPAEGPVGVLLQTPR